MTRATPSDLARRCAELGIDAGDPADALRRLEAAADAAPADRTVAAALDVAWALATASEGLPPILAGTRREDLVRVDAWSTTWRGVDVATGLPAVTRVLRPHLAKDPVARRVLRRDGRALLDIERGVVWDEHPYPALKRVLPGPSVDPNPEEGDDAGSLIRSCASALSALARWERAGLPIPRLEPSEWVRTEAGTTIATLTPGTPEDDVRDTLSDLAFRLDDAWAAAPATAIDPWIGGLAEAPPTTVAEASRDFIGHLAGALRRTQIHLAAAGRAVLLHDAHRRLAAALERLVAAVPPPSGIGAVGVDLMGAVRVVRSDGRTVRWGTIGEEEVAIRDERGDIAAAEARRLLRARAAAPPNPRLQAEIGGDEWFTEAICRWVASAHGARTIRLLLGDVQHAA